MFLSSSPLLTWVRLCYCFSFVPLRYYQNLPNNDVATTLFNKCRYILPRNFCKCSAVHKATWHCLDIGQCLKFTNKHCCAHQQHPTKENVLKKTVKCNQWVKVGSNHRTRLISWKSFWTWKKNRMVPTQSLQNRYKTAYLYAFDIKEYSEGGN